MTIDIVSGLPDDLPTDPVEAYRMGRRMGRDAEKRSNGSAERLFADQDRKLLHVAVRQVLFSELFPAAKDAGKGHTDVESTSWRDWIKGQMFEAVTRWSRGHDKTTLITDIVKEEVRKAIKDLRWSRTNDDFDQYVRKLAQAEANAIVSRLVADSFAIDVQLSGSIHQPAKGQRKLDTGDTE